MLTAEERSLLPKQIRTEEQLPGCWVAYTASYDGPGSPIGQGHTEQDAIDELLEIISQFNDVEG